MPNSAGIFLHWSAYCIVAGNNWYQLIFFKASLSFDSVISYLLCSLSTVPSVKSSHLKTQHIRGQKKKKMLKNLISPFLFFK